MAESEFESSDEDYLYSININDQNFKKVEITPLDKFSFNNQYDKLDDFQENMDEVKNILTKFENKELCPNNVESSNDIFDFEENRFEIKGKDLTVILSDETQINDHGLIDQNLANRQPIVYRKKDLFKMSTIDDSDSHNRISDKIQQLNKFYSLDNKSNLEKYVEKSLSVKKLSVDPDFQMKMQDLCHPIPNSSYYSNCQNLTDSKTDYKNNFNRLSSNCEIIEENLSPVSTTAKSLEHQLSFSSTPRSPASIPRIPKLSRFARLNKFLSVSSEPDENTASFIDNEQKEKI